jgi:Protein of unknown function (DUF2752)
MNAVPPKISAASSANRLAGIILAVVALAGAAVIFFFNPAKNNFYPVCQFHRLTGLECPGCGATRAAHALLHGDFSAALRDNALFVLALAGLAARGVWFGWKTFRGRTDAGFFPVKFLWPLLAAAVVFGVLRNLPGFAFLAPQ